MGKVDTYFYCFNQNNPGGLNATAPDFDIIEAPTARIANVLAEDIGIYFDRCLRSCDCEICDARWERVDEGNRRDTPQYFFEDVVLVPSVDAKQGYIHYMDGREVKVWGERRA